MDIGSDSRDRAFSRSDTSDTEVCNLNDLFVGGKQQVLRFDVSMNDAAFVCVRKTGADLFEIEQGSLKRQRSRLGQREKIPTGKILENDVVKSNAGEIDGGAVTETIYHVWVTDAIESHGFVLKV